MDLGTQRTNTPMPGIMPPPGTPPQQYPTGTTTTVVPAKKKRKAMKMPSIGSNKVEMLTDTNWYGWKEKIEALLHCYGLFGHIDGSDPRDTDEDDEEQALWEREDYIARSLILINLQGDQITHMSRSKTVFDAWQNLKTIHETRSQSSALLAKRNFYSLRAEESCVMTEHVTEMTKKRNELSNMGCDITEAEYKAVLVMSLPKSWATWTQSYLGAHADKGDSDKIRGYTSHELVSIILDEYNRRQATEEADKGYYAKTTFRGKKRKIEPDDEKKYAEKKKKCAICGRDNHPTDKCRFKGKPKCTNCGRFGHETAVCWGNKGPNTNTSPKKGRERANIARDPQEDELLEHGFISKIEDKDVQMSSNFDGYFSAYSWVADSGTTSHIVNDKNAFIKYTALSNQRITGIGNTAIEAQGRGTIDIITNVNNKKYNVTLEDVLYVPKAVNNLFSISRLDENGGKAHINNGTITLKNAQDQTIAVGKRMNRLYILDATTIIKENSAIVTEEPNSWNDWHKRFGHVGISGLQRLAKARIVDGYTVNEKLPFRGCSACIEAKHAHNPFPKLGQHKDTEPGELTHTDVWGPARPTAITGAKYYITFIDDSTR